MRICFLSHSVRLGGAERVLLETIEAFQSQGVECRVLVPGNGEFCNELVRLGVSFAIVSYPLWMSRGKLAWVDWLKSAVGMILNTIVVAWKIHRWQPDYVYSNTATVCVGAFASRLTGRPHIWHLHEFGMEDQGLSFLFGQRPSLVVIDRLSFRCICVSEALAAKYRRSIEPSKITVIYPSMHQSLRDGMQGETESAPLAPFGSPAKRFRCVIAGALMEGKGQDESVRAMARLKGTEVDAELLIVGDGLPAYRRELEDSIKTNQLEGRVHFAGQVADVLPLMRSSDAVLICSRSEAFGRVTIEGMFSGKPVIGARSGATAELIEEGVNGILYDQGDPADLAAKIEYLCHNPAVGKQLGINALRWVKSYFTRARYARELMSIVESLSEPAAKLVGPAPIA
jgi:glycosyltransferase involved in cell wall biosynthesis